MPDRRFDDATLSLFATIVSRTRSTDDLLNAESVLGSKYFGIRAMVSLPYRRTMSHFGPLTLPDYLFNDPSIVPYLAHPYIYLIHHELVPKSVYKIDYTVTFDTNSASYVKRIVEKHSLAGLRPEVASAFDKLLRRNLNFDPFFYYVENGKLLLPLSSYRKNLSAASPFRFWKTLDRDFRKNAICLQLFKSVNCDEYRPNSKLTFQTSSLKAAREALRFAHSFYTSQDGQDLIRTLIFLQRAILLQLLALYTIQFSSTRSPKAKLRQFLTFLEDEGEPYFERELIMASAYFQKPAEVQILNRVNRGGKIRGLLRVIDNLAWDITLPRLMERMFLILEAGDYMLPFLLTFDGRLRKQAASFPIKAVLIDRLTSAVLSIPETETDQYFHSKGWDFVKAFHDPVRSSTRESKIAKTDTQRLFQIRRQYARLLAVLNNPVPPTKRSS